MIHLRYLNLSDTPIVLLPESICKLYNLQTLKLRDCSELEILPGCMQDLVNLHHLDIRGASRLIEMPKGMSRLKHLNFLSDYILGKQEENGIRELATLNNLHGSFCISKLENVKNSDEALEAKMDNKKYINTLKLKWLPDGDIDDVQTERDILDKLQPHRNLKDLSISGYRGETFPDWLGLSCYSNMTRLSLKSCMNCCELPSLGQLSSLRHLELFKLDRLQKIGLEFYQKNNESFQHETPFKSLETLEIENMCRWQEWHFPDKFDGFPQLRILSIRNCPVLSGDLPAHLPALEQLIITASEELACSLPRAPNLHNLVADKINIRRAQPHEVLISETKLAMPVLECLSKIESLRVQRIQIGRCKSAISISADYLPASLQCLEIYECPKLTFSEPLQHKLLTEIQVLGWWGSVAFPLGDLPNLKKLEFSRCESMEYVVVAHALPSLLYLKISWCPSLVSLPALGTVLPCLQELSIYDCPKIDCFAEEWLPPSLKRLSVGKCNKLAGLIASKGLQSEGLTHLELSRCKDVKSFPREGRLPASLESLHLWSLPNLETLDCKGLHHLTSLKNFKIQYCGKLENIIEEHLLASIETICMWKCPLADKLKEMEGLQIQFDGYYS